MYKKRILISLLATTCLIAAPANANVGAGMSNWFDSMGGFTNTTPPSAYKGQTMNGYSGGGLYQRVPVKNYQLALMTPPSLNIGCGGIDLTAGSFSFINRAALTAMFQNIGTSLSYAFLLAIKSSMPEMSSLFEYLQDIANKVNSMNVNSCQMAEGIVSSVGSGISQGRTTGVDHVAGSVTNAATDSFSSWISTPSAKLASRNAVVAADPTAKSVISPGNVVWQALSHSTGLDDEDKRFIMSMTGTIIIRDASATGQSAHWDYIDPTGTSTLDFIGYKNDPATPSIPIFACDTTSDCLNPVISTTLVSTFTQMVGVTLDNLRNNVTSRGPQNISDFYLVDASSVPVWKMISVSADVHPGLIDAYKNLIAVDVAYSYVQRILSTASQLLAHEQHGTLASDASDALNKLNNRLDLLKSEMYTQRLVEFGKVAKEADLERQLQLLNQTMVAGLPAQAFTSMNVFGSRQ